MICQEAVLEKIVEEDPELMLFLAVANCRLGTKGWQDLFIDIFLNISSNELHTRAYDFISMDSDRFNSFNSDMQQFFLAKKLISTGDELIALPIIELFIGSLSSDLLNTSTIINELGRLYISAGEYRRGAQFLQKLGTDITIDRGWIR